MGVRKGSLCPVVVVCARMRQKLKVFLFLSVHMKSQATEAAYAKSCVKEICAKKKAQKVGEKETEIHAHMREKKKRQSRDRIELQCYSCLHASEKCCSGVGQQKMH